MAENLDDVANELQQRCGGPSRLHIIDWRIDSGHDPQASSLSYRPRGSDPHTRELYRDAGNNAAQQQQAPTGRPDRCMYVCSLYISAVSAWDY
jgi:hypothetical protein